MQFHNCEGATEMSNIITITLIISLQLSLLKLLQGRIAPWVSRAGLKSFDSPVQKGIFVSAQTLTMFIQTPGVSTGINIGARSKNSKHWQPHHGLYTEKYETGTTASVLKQDLSPEKIQRNTYLLTQTHNLQILGVQKHCTLWWEWVALETAVPYLGKATQISHKGE